MQGRIGVLIAGNLHCPWLGKMFCKKRSTGRGLSLTCKPITRLGDVSLTSAPLLLRKPITQLAKHIFIAAYFPACEQIVLQKV